MRWGFLLYRLGALGLLLSLGVFGNEPLAGDLKNGTASWPAVLILFGFTAAAGLLLLTTKPAWLEKGNPTFMYVSHGLALLAILWILLWCFVWLALLSTRGDNAEMFIKHIADLHLFGVGFTMAAYGAGWISPRLGERSARFAMGAGWASSYMAWINLYLQPGLTWLWAPAIGGLLLVLGAFLITRSIELKTQS
jgi:hypothetical protein